MTALTLLEAMDETIMVSRAEAEAELRKHDQCLLAYFADYPDEMDNKEFSSAKLPGWLGY